MITTTYTCDKCGHNQTNDKQMWDIGISISTHLYIAHNRNLAKRELWCRSCIESVGLLPPSPDSRKPPPDEPLSMEDLIREIVREEISP